MAATRAQVVARARQYLGLRWHHMARDPNLAVDCAGLVICVARDLELVAPDFDVPNYTETADGTMLDWCDAHMGRTTRAAMRVGDVIIVRGEGHPQHMGILGDYRFGGHSIIHASRPAGRVIETRLMFYRLQQFVAAYQLPRIVAEE